MTAPTMTINDVPYVERAPNVQLANAPAGACLQCAFYRDGVGCRMAIEQAAPAAFGGDCVERNVVYVHAQDRGQQA